MSVESPKTDCFGNAWRWARDHDAALVVHGKVRSARVGRVIDHAWVEEGDQVTDPTTGVTMEKGRWYPLMSAQPEAKYTYEQAGINMVRSGNLGPWTPDEVGKRFVWRRDAQRESAHFITAHLLEDGDEAFDPKTEIMRHLRPGPPLRFRTANGFDFEVRLHPHNPKDRFSKSDDPTVVFYEVIDGTPHPTPGCYYVTTLLDRAYGGLSLHTDDPRWYIDPESMQRVYDWIKYEFPGWEASLKAAQQEERGLI